MTDEVAETGQALPQPAFVAGEADANVLAAVGTKALAGPDQHLVLGEQLAGELPARQAVDADWHPEGQAAGRPVGLQAERYSQLINVYQSVGGGWVDIASSMAPQPQDLHRLK